MGGPSGPLPKEYGRETADAGMVRAPGPDRGVFGVFRHRSGERRAVFATDFPRVRPDLWNARTHDDARAGSGGPDFLN